MRDLISANNKLIMALSTHEFFKNNITNLNDIIYFKLVQFADGREKNTAPKFYFFILVSILVRACSDQRTIIIDSSCLLKFKKKNFFCQESAK